MPLSKDDVRDVLGKARSLKPAPPLTLIITSEHLAVIKAQQLVGRRLLDEIFVEPPDRAVAKILRDANTVAARCSLFAVYGDDRLILARFAPYAIKTLQRAGLMAARVEDVWDQLPSGKTKGMWVRDQVAKIAELISVLAIYYQERMKTEGAIIVQSTLFDVVRDVSISILSLTLGDEASNLFFTQYNESLAHMRDLTGAKSPASHMAPPGAFFIPIKKPR